MTGDHAQTKEWSRRTLRRNVVPVQLRGIVETLDGHEPAGWTNGHGPTDLDQLTWTNRLDQKTWTSGNRRITMAKAKKSKKGKKAKAK